MEKNSLQIKHENQINQQNQPHQQIQNKLSQIEIPNQEQIDKDSQENQNNHAISKKMKKKIEKRLKWQQIKIQKRLQKKNKAKQKKLLKKQNLTQKQQIMKNNQIQQKLETVKSINEEKQEQEFEKKQDFKLMAKRKDDYQKNMIDKMKIVIDLQFYSLMTDKQKISLIKQLSYCHSINRKVNKPFNFIITSAFGEAKNDLQKMYNAHNWGIILQQKNMIQVFPKQNIVYLTGDAKQQLQQFNQNDIYIIGGIVDHNRLKNITINYANQMKIRSARLPMKGIQLQASVHLAVNHIWEWMLKAYNGQTWQNSLKSTIPKRKIKQFV